MEYIPIGYEKLNLLEGHITPRCIKVRNNAAYVYWERTLFERAQSQLQINGWLPEWDGFGVKDFFWFLFLARGFAGFRETEKEGRLFGPCSFGGGLNAFFQPIKANFAIPTDTGNDKITYKIYDPVEDVNKSKNEVCAVVKFTPDARGIWDILQHYAAELALLDASIQGAIINSKIARVMGASSKAGAEVLKSAVDKINKGEPAVVVDKRILNDRTKGGAAVDPITVYEYFNANNYLTDKMLQDRQNILSAFDTEIGITSLPYQKKERMVVNEAESKDAESKARLNLWVDTMNDGLNLVNKMWGTNLSVTINDFGKEGGVDDGRSENDVVGN